jgi:2-methylfumaryl-CoA hydratase
MTKTTPGNFFEDFRLGQTITHATPRTVTVGDVALYNALYGGRFAVQSSDEFAKTIGYPRSPVDDLLVFHVVFGKTVPDISLNAVANLGYADCRFLQAVYPGDTLTATSEVIGLKENSSRKTGVVYVRSAGFKQDGTKVLEYVRWVMVRKRDEAAPAPGDHVPQLPKTVDPATLARPVPRSQQAPTTARSPAARIATATTRSARRSITSTAWHSKKPNISLRRGSIRTPRASTSICSPWRRTASAAAWSMAAW